MTRAGIYDRVSKDRRKGRSVAEQGEANRAACAEQGWQVVAEYEDNDRSASRHARKPRENWPLLLADLEARRFDVLMLWECSRGDRQLETWARLLSTCRQLGVLIHITSHEHTYDVRKHRDWKTLAEEGVASEAESEQTRGRILRTTASQAAKGAVHGRVPYGYRREYDPDTGALLTQVIREDQAAIVREAARRVLAGETPYAVAADFNERGIPAPAGGRWQITHVRRLLTNPIYNGKRTHHGRIVKDAEGRPVPAAWPAILDDTTYWPLVTKLTDPARRTVRDSAVRHLLTGIACCDECGGRTRVQAYGRKKYRKIGYVCHERRCVGIHKDKLEAVVEQVALRWLARDDVRELLAEGAGDTGDVAAAAAEVAKLRAELEQLYLEREQGLSLAGLARLEAPLLARIDDAERRARPRPVPAVLDKLAGPDAAEVWAGIPLSAKREAIELLMDVRVARVDPHGPRVFDPRRVKIRWRYPNPSEQP